MELIDGGGGCSVSANGTSDYRLNGKVVTYKKYNETLEGFNILVKAKNFLVFQVSWTRGIGEISAQRDSVLI